MSTLTIEPDRPRSAPPEPAPRAMPGLQVPGTALSILAALALSLVCHLTLVSQLAYERDQQTAFAELRGELARGTAPVGQFRTDFDDSPEGTERLVGPGTPVAMLTIPRVGLRAVVREGTDGGVLRAGPGHRRDTVLPGQAGTSVIMGRRAAYGGPFRDLDLLVPGDVVTATTGQGTHTYVVTGLRRPGDRAPEPAPGQGRLTLITALGTEFMPTDVLRVDANLVSEVQPTPARRFGASALPAAEQAMATDPDAWTPVLLWGQALLLAALALTWLRSRWGRWQSWIVGLPVLLAIGVATADQAIRLLPNLL
ncbi:sortase [Micromonospora sp. PLK6-60]|uniref:sortase domain-containing protein n=1 Tax=Micromonospora sp. PLK6-60 TaxID=2873383 RepID=UPI001CA71457|nr:sortase [Micromonospora sp. PLK6-60]MBY8871937.1 sortase [Micromonospora sp. PLK6-60]